MFRLRPFLAPAFVIGVFAAACSAPVQVTPDGGGGAIDAGPDAGDAVIDAGPDAGEEAIDAGPDAGEAPVDAGAETPDAGEETPDAGHCALPAAPADVQAEAGDGEATLTWTAAEPDCGGPLLSFLVTTTPGDTTQEVGAAFRTLQVKPLTNGTAYRFRVRSRVAAGESADSAESAAVVPKTIPGAPQSLVAEGAARSATLTWDAPASNGGAAITAYVVRRSREGAPVEEAGRTAPEARSFEDTGLEDGVLYDYDVRATNVAGEGSGATAQGLTRPGAPTGLVATAGVGVMDLSWESTRGAGRYHVFATSDVTAGFVEIDTSDSPGYRHTGLAPGTLYTYVIAAANASGTGPSSGPASDRTAPGTPSTLTAVAEADEAGLPRVALSWSASPGATEYELQRSTTAGSGHLTIHATAGTTFVDSQVDAERSYFYVVRARSAAGSSARSAEAVARTATLPVLAPVLASPAFTKSTAATLTVAACTGRDALLVNEGSLPAGTGPGWQPCSTATGALTYTLPAAPQGLRTLSVWSRGTYGHVFGPETVTLTFDSTAPALVLSPPATAYRGGTAQVVRWTATELNHAESAQFTVEGSLDDGATYILLGTVPATAGPLNSAPFELPWTTPTADAAQARLRVSFTDRAGNETRVRTDPFTIDSTAPAFTAGRFLLDGGATTTTSHLALVALAGTDNLTPITHLCLKTGAAAPTSTDPCWLAVDGPGLGLVAATTLTLADYPLSFGFLTGHYEVFGWLRDSVGNTSARTDPTACTTSAGTDCARIALVSPAPPRIDLVVSARSDTVDVAPEVGDRMIQSGGDVYVKWQVTDERALPLDAISLSYTTDDATFVTIVTGLANAPAPDCLRGPHFSGCYRWSSPPALAGSPFRVRITVTNAEGVTASAMAVANNVMGLNFLAGNTDPGLGSSAKAAVFFNEMGDADEDPQSFARASNGTFYFRDARRGLLVVSPSDGLQRLLIPTTGAMSPDGIVANATLKRPLRIALDHQDRLLIFDDDRIRRYDPVAGTLVTTIGGGNSFADGVAPLAAQLSPITLSLFRSKAIAFAAAPNGDIYFQDRSAVTPSATGYRLRVLKAATSTIQSTIPNGTGIGTLTSQDIAACAFAGTVLAYDPVTSAQRYFGAQAYSTCSGAWANFDPATGASRSPGIPNASLAAWVTGMDGQAYVFSTTRGYGTDNTIKRFDQATNTLVRLVGTGASGSCPDNTLPLDCAVTPRDAFVTRQGQLFFMDRARLRTIDPVSGRVVTVMGQSFAYGDGGPALAARFGAANSLSLLNDGEIIVSDNREKRFRQFRPGGTIRTIAGNGTDGAVNITQPATEQPLVFAGYHLADDVAADPETGALVLASGGYLLKLNRATGFWERLAGGGATFVRDANGLPGSSINIGSTITRALGFDGTRFLLNINGNTGGPFYKLYGKNDGTQTGLMGVDGPPEGTLNFCPDNTAATLCPVMNTLRFTHTRATWDAFGARWALLMSGTSAIRSAVTNGMLGTITTLATPARSFAYRHDATTHVVYYCSTADDRIRRKDVTTGTETTLPWPLPSVRCSGRAMVYDEGRFTLVFPYEQNGLYGIAEYLSP